MEECVLLQLLLRYVHVCACMCVYKCSDYVCIWCIRMCMVCACVCTCKRTLAHLCMCVGQMSMLLVFCHSPPYDLRQGLLLNLPLCHFSSSGWAGSPQDPLVSLTSTRIAGVFCQAWPFIWVVRLNLRLRAVHQIPGPLNHLPSCDSAHPCIPKVRIFHILYLLCRCTFPLR